MGTETGAAHPAGPVWQLYVRSVVEGVVDQRFTAGPGNMAGGTDPAATGNLRPRHAGCVPHVNIMARRNRRRLAELALGDSVASLTGVFVAFDGQIVRN